MFVWRSDSRNILEEKRKPRLHWEENAGLYRTGRFNLGQNAKPIAAPPASHELLHH